MKVKQSTDILIIGGGLTALTLAYYLREKNIDFRIVESRKRLGGRIHTIYKEGNTSLEMGATWISEQHTHLLALLNELELEVFPQKIGETAIYEPDSLSPAKLVQLPPQEPSYRIVGGTMTIINKLAAFIDTGQVHLGQEVSSIEDNGNCLIVKTQDLEFKANTVISTLPPKLLISNIKFIPRLSNAFTQIAQNTHTWMGESIKIGLYAVEPFWRNLNSSGTLFSNLGPIIEMYDHSNFEDTQYALKGFIDNAYFAISKEDRKERVLQQLAKYYGKDVEQLVNYEELVWREEKCTFREYNDQVLPHQNNGHSAFQELYMDGKLIIGGAETAKAFPGYMEGSIRRAKQICEQILQV